MVHNIDAIYDHGVFRPIAPVTLPEGARVRLRVEDENGVSASGDSDYSGWVNGIAGRWSGEFVRGGEEPACEDSAAVT